MLYYVYIYTPSGLHPYKWRFLAGKFIETNGGFQMPGLMTSDGMYKYYMHIYIYLYTSI